MTVSRCTNSGNACRQEESVFRPEAVDTVLIVILVNKFLEHRLECIPVPVALLEKLPWVVKTVSFNSSLVVNHDLFSSNACYKVEVLAAEAVSVHTCRNVLPDSAVNVRIAVYRLEHSADNALGEVENIVAGEDINAYAAENVSGKSVVTAVPVGGDPFDISAVFSLKHFKRNRL